MHASLAKLIKEQRSDDRSHSVKRPPEESPITDMFEDGGLAWFANRPDRRREPTVLVGSSKIWGAAEASYSPGPLSAPCPACHDAIQEDHYCLVCSASGGSPKQWPAQEPPVRIEAREKAEQLAGGLGRPRKRPPKRNAS